MSGVPSQQSRPWNRKPTTFDSRETDKRRSDRIGPQRRSKRERAKGLATMGWILQNQVPARSFKPVQNIQTINHLKAGERLHPRLEYLNSALRPVQGNVVWAVFRLFPGCVNSADKTDAGVIWRREVDCDLVLPQTGHLCAPVGHGAVALAPPPGFRTVTVLSTSQHYRGHSRCERSRHAAFRETQQSSATN